MDEDKNGTITLNELQCGLTKLGSACPAERELSVLMQSIDIDNVRLHYVPMMFYVVELSL